MNSITSKITLVAVAVAIAVLGVGCHRFGLSESDSEAPEASESDGYESDDESDVTDPNGVKAQGYHEEGADPAASTTSAATR